MLCAKRSERIDRSQVVAGQGHSALELA